MSDNTSTFQDMLRLCVKALGYEESLKLVNSMNTVVQHVEEKKVEETEDKKKTKRIPKMTPTLSTELKTQLSKTGLNYTEDNKKEFEKVKKEFLAYIDELTEKDYKALVPTEHMKAFAERKNPKPTDEEKK